MSEFVSVAFLKMVTLPNCSLYENCRNVLMLKFFRLISLSVRMFAPSLKHSSLTKVTNAGLKSGWADISRNALPKFFLVICTLQILSIKTCWWYQNCNFLSLGQYAPKYLNRAESDLNIPLKLEVRNQENFTISKPLKHFWPLNH